MKSTTEELLDRYSAARLLTEGYSREENFFQTHMLMKGNHFKAGCQGWRRRWRARPQDTSALTNNQRLNP